MRNLKGTLELLGLQQTEFARLIDVNPRTVSLWVTGKAPLPGPAGAYLRVLQSAGPGAVSNELSSLARRSRMLDEGIYSVCHRNPEGGPDCAGNAIAVLRSGKILGSDREGGLFSGSYEFDPASGLNHVQIRFSIPPEGTLVTGFTAGSGGATLDIVGEFTRASPVSKVVIDIDSQPIEVELSYLGPLPN